MSCSPMAKTKFPEKPTKKIPKPSWAAMRSLITCRHAQTAQPLPRQRQRKAKQEQPQPQTPNKRSSKKCKKVVCSGSLCNNTKVMHRLESTSSLEENKKRPSLVSSSQNNGGGSTSSRSLKTPLHQHETNNRPAAYSSSSSSSCSGPLSSNSSLSASSSLSSISGSFRVMPFSRFSGCYECRMVVDPLLGFTRDSSLRATIFSCPECGEIFMKAENLELHQAVKHAVSELGPEDTSKNIVEIIFQSSWLKKQTPICKIERILKVQNTPKTISRFEEYRDSVKAKASKFPKKHPRCAADGNELLRFHCATFACSIGAGGSSSLCAAAPTCGVCSIIKNGFKITTAVAPGGGSAGKGILTTATSGRAHDEADVEAAAAAAAGDGERAILVCRVIAGRVKKGAATQLDGSDEFDSVSGSGASADGAVCSNLEELYVFNPKAILPCFVVIYRIRGF